MERGKMVSDQEIQREMDNLRSIRRRSMSSGGPGAIPLDPDLPPVSPTSPSSTSSSPPKNSYASLGLNHQSLPLSPSKTSPNSVFNRSRSGSGGSGSGGVGGLEGYNNVIREDDEDRVIGRGPGEGSSGDDSGEDQSHLFWVPARLHPDLAPQEFRAFLKTHSHTDSEGVVDGVGEATGALAGHVGVGGSGMGLGVGGSGPGLARSPSWLARSQSSGRGGSGSGPVGAGGMTVRQGSGSGPGFASGVGGGGLGRKRSMLSKQYQPRFNDGVESEAPPVPSEASRLMRSNSNRNSIYGGVKGDQGVTLEELQRLETLVDEAAAEGGGEEGKMSSLLRHSLSMRLSPGYVEDPTDGAQLYDDDNTPIIAARPGQILRRNARTKIRKPGEGVGPRFGSRKGRSTDSHDYEPSDREKERERDVTAAQLPRVVLEDTGSNDGPRQLEKRDSGDKSDDSDEMYSAESEQTTEELAYLSGTRRVSADSTEESAIVDSYADSSADTSAESSTFESMTSVGESSEMGYGGEKKHQQQQQVVSSPDRYYAEDDERERTPTGAHYSDSMRRGIVGYNNNEGYERRVGSPPSSPETVRKLEKSTPSSGVPHQENAYAQLYSNPPPQPPAHDRAQYATLEPVRTPKMEPAPVRQIEKQPSSESLKKVKEEKKKGGFFSSKKDKDKDKDKDSKGKKGEKKEKEGLFGSLFGGKKKTEEPAPLKFSAAGPAAAAALLGTSKSAKSLGLIPMNGHSPTSPGFSPYARYPIHVERAIYRLSHIKLANPRRPLYEQVLISNLMFWYLGIINKVTPTPSPTNIEDKEKTAEKEKESVSEKAPVAAMSEKQAPSKSLRSVSPSPSNQRSASAPQPAPEPALSAKRTGLTKPEQSRNRTAETPIRQPQYGMQNMQMQQEYSRTPQSSSQPGRSTSPQNAPPQTQQRRSASSGNLASTARGPTPEEQYRQSPSARPARSPEPPAAPRQPPSPSRSSAPKSPPPRDNAPQRPRIDTAYQQNPPPQPQSRPSERVPSAGHTPYPQHQPGRPFDQRDRRASDSVKDRPPVPQHPGVQPGQIFHHPSNMINVQPGQIFHAPQSPGQQVGQIFQHPQYAASSPTMVTQHGGYPSNNWQQQQQPGEQERRLPPGAMPPRAGHSEPTQWRNAPPPQQQHGGQPHPGNPYDYDPSKRPTHQGHHHSSSGGGSSGSSGGGHRDFGPGQGGRSFSASGGPPSSERPLSPPHQYHQQSYPQGRTNSPSSRTPVDDPPYNPYMRQPIQPHQNQGPGGYYADRR